MSFPELLSQVIEQKKTYDKAEKQLKTIKRLDKDRDTNVSKLKSCLKTIDGISDLLIPAPEIHTSLKRWMDTYDRELQKSEEQIRQRFGKRLYDELQSIDINMTGQFPDFRVGLFSIEVNLDRDQAVLWYGPKQEKLGVCSLSPPEIVKRLVQIPKQLGTQLGREAFLKNLNDACNRVGQDRRTAPIVEVLGEMAYMLQDTRFRQDPRQEHYREYTRADFSYDLFRYGRPHAILTVAIRSQTRSRQDFLWVPENDQGKGSFYLSKATRLEIAFRIYTE